MTYVAHVGKPPNAFYVFVRHLNGNSTAIARHNPPLWIGTLSGLLTPPAVAVSY